MKLYRVWPIIDHPSKGDTSEGFDNLLNAVARAKQLATNGDAWAIGLFTGYDDEDWASFNIQYIVFGDVVFAKTKRGVEWH